MFEIVKNSIDDFKASYKKYLSFALLYMLLTSVLFVPLISIVFNRMVRIIGTGSLLNAEVYKIGLSSTGMLAMLFIGFLAVVILLVEFGVMIIISHHRYFEQNVLVSDAFMTTIKKLPKLLGFGFFQLIILILLIIPFIELAAFPALLDFNLPILLTNLFYGSSNFSLLLYMSVFVLAIYFFVRSIFTLHSIFIEEKPIWEALKCSWKMTKYSKLQIIFNICFLNIVIFVIAFLFVTVLSYIPTVTDMIVLGNIIERYLITLSSYMTLLFYLLFIPVNIIIITRLFYLFKENHGDIVHDELTVQGNKKLVAFEKWVTRFFTKRKYTLVAIILLIVTGMFVINDTVKDNIVYLKWNVQVAAHRGDLHSAPENSLSSVRAAIEKGVDVVEIDVMLTKDGVVILNHDTTLQRVAGVPTRVQDLTYEEVYEVDIGRLFSEEFIGEKIPTLDEVLKEVKDENVKIIVDLKPTDSSGDLAAKVVELIEKHEMVNVTYVQAFDYHSLQVVRNRNKDIKIGQILYLSAGNLAELDVDFYTIRQTMLTDRFIKNAKAQNREVWVWTVNIERNMREVLKYDIDGIITDYPEKLLSISGIDFVQE